VASPVPRARPRIATRLAGVVEKQQRIEHRAIHRNMHLLDLLVRRVTPGETEIRRQRLRVKEQALLTHVKAGEKGEVADQRDKQGLPQSAQQASGAGA